MIIPQFKEVYTKEIDGDTVKTICTLVVNLTSIEKTEGAKEILHSINDQLSFGISKTSVKSRYNKNLGMKLSYAMAMRFLILKINNGEKYVEDNIK
jgi:hypothetical protein